MLTVVTYDYKLVKHKIHLIGGIYDNYGCLFRINENGNVQLF